MLLVVDKVDLFDVGIILNYFILIIFN